MKQRRLSLTATMAGRVRNPLWVRTGLVKRCITLVTYLFLLRFLVFLIDQNKSEIPTFTHGTVVG